MPWYLGIEIGGTKLQIAVGHGEGEPFRGFWRGPIDASGRAGRIQDQIVRGVDELLSQVKLTREQVGGVGIGFGGPVDSANGQIVTSHQVEGWDRFPLVEWVETNLKLPAVLHNDADTAALAEARFGAGRGFDPVMYVTVGSGIGGGLVVDGSIFRGCGAGAMEIGHLRPGQPPLHVPLPAPSVEAVASGFGIEDRARRTIAEWEEATVLVESRFQMSDGQQHVGMQSGVRQFPERFSLLMKLAGGDRRKITTRLIGQAAAQGDRLSRDLLSDCTDTLGWALAQAVTLINPARIVIGGGVSLMGHEQFIEPLRRACREAAFKPFATLAEIVSASLGEEVVVHGAVALARDAFHKETTLKAYRGDDTFQPDA